jgi:hypothetical protein
MGSYRQEDDFVCISPDYTLKKQWVHGMAYDMLSGLQTPGGEKME